MQIWNPNQNPTVFFVGTIIGNLIVWQRSCPKQMMCETHPRASKTVIFLFFRVELRGSSEARTEQAHLSEAKMSVAKGVIAKQA